ncbi:hypothetical protein FRX31_003702 [Thalictrum thalictroides]|uniref:Uncharacterized protein n=1 Tax=Thalictrum thalictroides TaxID=46969 RepID=A0A7J6XA94_THATH|nr:hypothetical protein FRX31_003702 [Thalictrum thalictroides]
MDAISSSSNVPPRVEQTATRSQFRRGNDRELIKIENAKLWFIGGQELNRVVGIVKEGNFSVRMVIQSLSPALMTKCNVDDIEWPLTTDSPVLQIGARSFAFAMPGLLYGLQFAPNHEEIFQTLERIFMRFGCYQDLTAREYGKKIFGPEDDPYFWPLSQLSIETISQTFLKRVGTYWRRDQTRVFNMNDRVLRVQYMSFVVKLITKGLLIGKIDPNEHVILTGKKWPPEAGDVVDEIESRASPTIFLFSDLVEAFEESKVLMNMQYHLIAPYEPRWTPIPNFAFWNINKKCLLMMLTVIKSAVFLDIEVNIKAFLGQGCQKLFVPFTLVESGENGAATAAEATAKEEEEEVKRPRREIRFPILDEVGTSKQQGNKNLVQQIGLASANLELQKLKEKVEPADP